VTIFDGIEFNESLRWIDVVSEVAFTFMDLVDHGQRGLAQRFLNGYLEHTGDYGGLAVLRFYAVYRALVRAKVAGLRLAQPDLAPDERTEQNTFRRGYVVLARLLTKPDPVRLLITHGLSGSGKSTGTQALLEQLPAIRIRSDIERKRLGLSPDALYTPQATAATYDRLLGLAEQILADGYAVIVDATFLQRAERQRFQDLAAKLAVPYTILHFDAPHEALRKRVAARQARGSDPSDATVDVLEHQIRTAEPFDESERAFVQPA
jgi:predicted kinase